jgi:4-hydroxybenzoate polyprenyltransferase
MIALFLLTVIVICLYEGIPLTKQRLWRELATLGLLIGSSFSLGVAKLLGVSSPLNWLEHWLGPIGKMIFK